MKAPKTQKSRNVAPGANDYKTIPQSAHLVKENQIPEGVSVVSDNDFYGNPYDQFDYKNFAHSKRKLVEHEKKVKASFKTNWVNDKNPMIDVLAKAASNGGGFPGVVYVETQSGKPLNIK